MKDRKTPEYWLSVFKEIIKVYPMWNSQLKFYGNPDKINIVIQVPLGCVFNRTTMTKLFDICDKYDLKLNVSNSEEIRFEPIKEINFGNPIPKKMPKHVFEG